MKNNNHRNDENDDLDDLLDSAFNLQDKIHHKCKIRDNPKDKQKKWEEKYGIR